MCTHTLTLTGAQKTQPKTQQHQKKRKKLATNLSLVSITSNSFVLGFLISCWCFCCYLLFFFLSFLFLMMMMMNRLHHHQFIHFWLNFCNFSVSTLHDKHWIWPEVNRFCFYLHLTTWKKNKYLFFLLFPVFQYQQKIVNKNKIFSILLHDLFIKSEWVSEKTINSV